MDIFEPKVIHNFIESEIQGKDVIKSSKYFKDIKDIYENPSGIEDDTLMYDVYSYINGDQSNIVNLNYGLSVLHPVLVNGECNMTRGHFHDDAKFPEIYVGLGGNGLLMMSDKKGYTFCEKVFAGSVHYIDGNYSHRLINIGDDDLRVLCVWSPCAGHDYESILKFNYKYRVFIENKEIITKKI